MWCETPGIELDEEDCQYIFNRLTRMDHARPKSAPRPSTFTRDLEEQWAIEQRQLTAFEAGAPDWWLIRTDEDLANALTPPPLGEVAAQSADGGGSPPEQTVPNPPPLGKVAARSADGGGPPHPHPQPNANPEPTPPTPC